MAGLHKIKSLVKLLRKNRVMREEGDEPELCKRQESPSREEKGHYR
jgi:hypothetical protein